MSGTVHRSADLATRRVTAWKLMAPIKWLLLVTTLFAALPVCVQAGPAEDQFAVGAAHYREQRWQLAVDEFSVFLERYPSHAKVAEAQFRTAEAFVQLGEYATSDGYYRQFLEHTKNSENTGNTALTSTGQFRAKVLFRRGEVAYFMRQSVQARKRLREFRNQFPSDPHNHFALVYLGDLALLERKFNEAQKWFALTISDFSDGAMIDEAHFGLARSLDGLGHHSEALAKYRELANRKGRASRQARLQLALAAYRERQFEQAEQQLSSFEGEEHRDGLHTQALYWLGMSRQAQQQWFAAAKTFSAAVSNDPQHVLAPRLHFNAGDSYRHASQLEDAQSHFDAILSQWSESEFVDDALLGQIRLAYQAGQLPRVTELAQQFTVQHPASECCDNVREIYARVLLAQGRHQEADQLFRNWLQDANRLPNNTSWYLCSLAQLGTGQHNAALVSLGRVELQDENSPLHKGILVAHSSALMGVGRFEEAMVPLRDYLRLFGDGADVAKCQSDLAMCLAKTGELDEASDWWERFCETNPGHVQLLPIAHFLAETAYAEGDRVWAAQLFAYLAEKGNPAEYVRIGVDGLHWCQQETVGADASAATFERLLKENPNSPQAPIAALARGRALEHENRLDGALATYQLIIDQFSTSRQMPEALFAAARLHDRLEQDRDALRLLERLHDEHPDFGKRDASLYLLAWVHNDLVQPAQANAAFREIYDEHPGTRYWADATYRMAEDAIEAKEFGRAQQLCSEVAERGCDEDLFAHVLYLQGRAAALAAAWDDVIPPLERLNHQFPGHDLNFAAEYWIAETFYRQGKYADAGDRFARLANGLNGNQQGMSWTAVIPIRQAQVFAQQNRWADALERANQVVEQFPDFRQLYEAYYLVGRCLAADGKFAAARQAYEQVLSSPAGGQSETAAMAQWMIGETYFHQKEYDAAIRAYLRVEILYGFPRWRAHALLQAGKCYEISGVESEAIRLYARVLKEFPDSEVAEQASARLQSPGNPRL